MGLTGEMVKSCLKSLGELERIIITSLEEYRSLCERPDRTDPDVTKRASVAEELHRRGMGIWQRWEKSVNSRLQRFEIQTIQPAPFGELAPSSAFEPALRSIAQVADGCSIEALEELSKLVIISARAVRTLERIRYVAEHPYPWQQQAGAAARPQVTDAEVSRMIEDIGKTISHEEHGGDEEMPEP